MSREQQLKIKKDMELPVNKFLNAKDKDGNAKYSVAAKLYKYFVNNPDPILDDMRLANALLHNVRWHKSQSAKYLDNFTREGKIDIKDKEGKIMEKDECYLAHISSEQNTHIGVSNLREHLSNKMLSKVDGDFFTFDQYNEFIEKVGKKLEELGFELFPCEVKLIEPL